MSEVLEQEMILNSAQQDLLTQMKNPFRFWLFLMTSVPAGWIAGMRLKQLGLESAVATVPYKFLNKNPFQSIYFAVQSMAAEMSTASLVLLHTVGQRPSVAYIIVDMKSNYTKKATDKVYFTCTDGHKVKEALDECLATGEPRVVDLNTVGKMADGTVVSEFTFSWSMKQRSK